METELVISILSKYRPILTYLTKDGKDLLPIDTHIPLSMPHNFSYDSHAHITHMTDGMSSDELFVGRMVCTCGLNGLPMICSPNSFSCSTSYTYEIPSNSPYNHILSAPIIPQARKKLKTHAKSALVHALFHLLGKPPPREFSPKHRLRTVFSLLFAA